MSGESSLDQGKDPAGSALNVVELYAGTARSADAFREWTRCHLALLVDSDEFAASVYKENHPNAPYLVGNLSRLTPAEIQQHAGGRVDVLLGCPPCQGFSDTGSRDPDDWRNRHLTRFRIFVEALRPLAVAMENVPLAGGGRRFGKFVSSLERLGYRATWGILNSALHGSAQCRHRLLYVAIRGDVKRTPLIMTPTHGGGGLYFNYSTRRMASLLDARTAMLADAPAVQRLRRGMPHDEGDLLGKEPIPTVGDAIEDLPRVGSITGKKLAHDLWTHSPAMKRRMARVPEGGRWRGGSDHFAHSYGRLHRGGLARTVTTFFSNPGSGRFWHPTEDRCLSIREAARLQGFPDSFRLPNHELRRTCGLVGNALDGALADAAYRAIRSALE
jgi:DNA (cytosine-5)-methyltransferase 1